MYAYVCVSMCMCLYGRKRGRGVRARACVCVCVRVCVCVGERGVGRELHLFLLGFALKIEPAKVLTHIHIFLLA